MPVNFQLLTKDMLPEQWRQLPSDQEWATAEIRTNVHRSQLQHCVVFSLPQCKLAGDYTRFVQNFNGAYDTVGVMTEPWDQWHAEHPNGYRQAKANFDRHGHPGIFARVFFVAERTGQAEIPAGELWRHTTQQ